jgi:hypothetical protein
VLPDIAVELLLETALLGGGIVHPCLTAAAM